MSLEPPIRVGALALALTVCARAQVPLFDRFGDTGGDQFGTAVASVGDVDADGANDWAVGAPYNDAGGLNAGQVRVFSGRSLLVLFTWQGAAAQDRLGTSVAAAGDLDGDGHADVIAGARGAGRAYAYSGATGSILLTLSGTSGAWFGHAVAGGGDVDGDQVPDLLVGAPHGSNAATWDGTLFVYSGASGALVRTHQGPNGYSTFGWSATFLGDVDGDGRDEYASGAPAAYTLLSQSHVRTFDGATGAMFWTDDTGAFNDELGWSLARLADVTGDGIDDLLTGAPQDPGIGCACLGKGFVRALDGASGAAIYEVYGTSVYAGLGWAVAAIGDLDLDGYEDFACSQPGTEGCGSNTQAVQVRDGQTGAVMLSIAPASAGSQLGYALASGDANGDGLRDLICGAPCADVNGTDSGSVHVYTLVRAPTVYCESEPNSLGCTPSIAGSGSPSVSSGSPFDIAASNVLSNKSGLLFYGFKPRQTGFQGGHMCIVAPTTRTPIQSSGGTPPPADDCTGVFSLDFNARIQSGVDPLLVAGEEVFAQYWSRDPADQSTTNLTDALAFYIRP